MGYFEQKEPPKREDRLKACIAHGNTICGLANRPVERVWMTGNGALPRGQFVSLSWKN